jgi:hypothetical protein
MLMNPIFPDAQPYDSYLMIAIAILVVWVNRKTMFTKTGAVTWIVPPTPIRPIRSSLQRMP